MWLQNVFWIGSQMDWNAFVHSKSQSYNAFLLVFLPLISNSSEIILKIKLLFESDLNKNMLELKKIM